MKRYMTRKWTYLLAVALLALVSCIREEAPKERAPQTSVEGKKVRVDFSLAGGAAAPSTKGLDNGGDISHMYVAVFGSSGYLKEYAEAALVTAPSESDPYYTFTVDLTITDSPRKVHFLGNGPSSLPFGYDTAVIPIQMSRLNDQQQGEKAYWQMIDLPDGIQAKRDSQGNFVDEKDRPYYVVDDKGNIIVNPDFGNFVLDPSQEDSFKEIPLIRNWAKIVLYTQEDSHFTPISFSVINFPTRGAIAPYSGKTNFIRDYQELDFPTLQGMGYTANLPAGTEFDNIRPSAEDFEIGTYDNGAVVYDEKKIPEDGDRVAMALQSKQDVVDGKDTEGHAVYLYERPVPSEKIPPTYVIVYGYYHGDSDVGPEAGDHAGYYYYKVDLMETFKHESGEWESSYYPIYRNFKYQICITKILSMGHASPDAAAASAGSADVSADISTGHISDISDGVGRLHLTWMSQSYNSEVTAENPETTLKVYFATTNGEPIGTDDNPAVTIKRLPTSDGGSDIIFPAGESIDPQDPDGFVIGRDDDGDGWRPVVFCTAAPGRTIRSQTLRITGTHNEGRLYRDVVITVLPTQKMLVSCEYPVLHAQKGAEQTITISIPEGLTKSLFPIEFEIEPQDKTLTPDTNKPDNNLPVVIAESISDDEGYAGKSSYHFTRTLTWDQYKAAKITQTADGSGDKTWRTFSCYFKTNCVNNATKVWVRSKYFNKTSASFYNYGTGLIHDALIPMPVPAEAGEEIQFDFQIERDEYGKFPEMTLRLMCLYNDGDKNPGLIRSDVDSYVFTPTEPENTLYFFSTATDGEFALELSAPGYNTVTVSPYHFNKGVTTRSYGLLDGVCDPLDNASFWSNMAFGKAQRTNNRGGSDRGVIFGYYDDPDCPGTTEITLSDGEKSVSDNNNTSGVKGSYSSTPAAKDANVNPLYHEIQLMTVGARKNYDIHLVLSSPGYVTETYNYSRLAEKTHVHTSYYKSSDYNASTRILKPADADKSDRSSFHMTFTPLEGAPDPVVVSNKICLGQDGNGNFYPGSRYEIKVESGSFDDIANMNKYAYAKKQRFYCGFFKIDSGYEPASCEPATGSGSWFQYPGKAGWFQWLSYDDPDEYEQDFVQNPVKTMIVTVGEEYPIRISNFTYKAVSDFN